MRTFRNWLLVLVAITLFSPQWVGAQPVGVLRAARALLADGTAGAPAFSWANDTDLGLYRIGANQAGFVGALALAQGSITADIKALNITSTWNAAGVTFGGIFLNVTDTASAAASLLLDLQVGGASKFKVDKAGAATLATALGIGTTPASAGVIRLPTDTFLNWRNLANTADVGIYAHGGGWFEVNQHWAPAGTNLYDLGGVASPLQKWRSAHISKYVKIYGQGASPNMPAEDGFVGIHLVNDSGFTWRNAANTADISAFVGTDNVFEFSTGLAVRIKETLSIGTTPATGGLIAIPNAQMLVARNAANTANVNLLTLNSLDQLVLSVSGNDIRWGVPLVALGGGAAPTLGTIGGSGPATAAQNSWLRVIDSAGVTAWIPVWK